MVKTEINDNYWNIIPTSTNDINLEKVVPMLMKFNNEKELLLLELMDSSNKKFFSSCKER